MKPRHAAVLAVLVAVVFGGWFFFLRNKGHVAKKPVAQAHGTDPWAGGPKEKAQRPDADRGAPQGEQQVLVDDDPEGAMRLEGLVLGGDDKPVAGAIVSLSANPPRSTKSD